jgi:hypothetical protein
MAGSAKPDELFALETVTPAQQSQAYAWIAAHWAKIDGQKRFE